jgi:hypothetical protein
MPPTPAAPNFGVGLRRPTGDRSLAGEEQLGRCPADQGKYYRLYLQSFKVTLAEIFLSSSRLPPLRGGAGACFNSRYAACACGTVSHRGPPGGRRVVACLGRWRALPLRGPSLRVERLGFRPLYALFKKVLMGGRDDATHHARS